MPQAWRFPHFFNQETIFLVELSSILGFFHMSLNSIFTIVIGVLILAIMALVMFLVMPSTDRLGLFWEKRDTGSSRLSSDVRETFKDVRETFWVENDYENSYRILKAKTEEIKVKNSQQAVLSETDLNDEMWLMSDFAAIARLLNPEEGLSLYAEIYGNEKYTYSVRADALFEVMVYLNEKLGSDLTVYQANEWIYGQANFAAVLLNSSLAQKTYLNADELKESVIIGLNAALDMDDSRKGDVKITALLHDVEAELLEAEADSLTDSDFSSRVGRWLSRNQGLLSELLPLMEDEENYKDFVLEFPHASKNILRAYTRLQGLGVDIGDRFDKVYSAEMAYLSRYTELANISIKKHASIQMGVAALFNACNIVQKTPSPANLDRNVLANALAPFLSLSAQDQARFSAPAAVGAAGSGACYQEYVSIGKLIPEFKLALISNVGGWQMEQFR